MRLRILGFLTLLLSLAIPASATNFTVKAGGGGNYTTIQACATAMSAGDTCTVYAGTYSENVTVSAGTVGNYKTITVNGTDAVSVLSFTINSHVKIIGNCSVPSVWGSCGFTLGNTASPSGATCISGTNNMTDYFIVGNVMQACTFIVTGPNGSNSSYGVIQNNTMSYSCSTPASPNVCTAGQLRGNFILVQGNDMSHVSDGFYIAGAHMIYRRNRFHDILATDCGSNSGNCHIDFMQADANFNGGALPAQYLVFEENITESMNGSDMHGIGLFQGEACSGNCFNAIVRFHQTSHVTGAGIVDDNSEAACPAWSHVKSYNNDWIDMVNSTGQVINNTSYCSTNAAYVNDIYYWPASVSNINGYITSGGGGSSTSPFTVGNNLAYCPGCTAASIHPHTYGSGSWTADAGNIVGNPLFNNYSANDFSLTSGSPARNAGKPLTVVSGTITSSTTLVVADADYFQDGYTIPGVQGDCIAVTSIGHTVCITAVNYSTNTLTLSAPISATNGDSVWIYSISDGTVVLTDTTGPDLGAIPFSQPVSPTVMLPQNWVNNNEWIGTTTYTLNFPSSWTCGLVTYGPYTAGNQASLQQAITDAEVCRTTTSNGTQIVLPAGTLYSGANGLTLPQTAGDTSSNFIVLTSSSPLPQNRTVCSGGPQDNLALSTHPGIRNVLCDGSQMSYQLGTTVTSISPGAFTLANGTVTSTSAYNDVASMYTIQCTAANCHAIQTATYDANNIGPHHYAILYAEVRPVAGLAQANSIIKLGLQTETLTSQLSSHIHIGYSWVHGDWTDAPVSLGVATGPPTGANSIPAGIACSGCYYTSITYSYLDRMIRPGAEGHGIFLGYWNQVKVVHNWVEGASIGLFSGGFASTVTLTGFGNDVEDRGNRYTYPYSWMLAFQAGFCVNGLSCSGNSYVRKNSHEFKNGNRVLDDGNINENVDNSGAQNGIEMSWKANNCSNGFCNNYWLSMENVTRTNGLSRNTCQGMSWGFRSATDSANGGGVTLPTEIALIQNNLSYNIDLNGPGCSTAGPEEGFRVNQAGTGNTWTATAVRDSAGATTTLTLASTPGGTQSDFNVGDPVYVSGCADTTFDTTPTAMGPLALAGTLPTGLTVVYTNAGTANAATTGCTVSNIQGWPRYLTHSHNSEFINTTAASSPYSTAANGGVYQLGRNLSFTNDIFVGGGINASWGEGTRTETKAFDPNTEAMNNTLFPGRDALVTCPGHSSPAAGGFAICYTEYSNSSVPSTPATLYGVPTSYSTGNDPTVGNVAGILGAMSQSSFPTTLSDWHNYRLCHAADVACNHKASFYAAGQSHQASDGTDLGVATTAIDAAEVSTLYTCATPCGSGPFPDVVSSPQTQPPAPATKLMILVSKIQVQPQSPRQQEQVNYSESNFPWEEVAQSR